MSALDCQTVRDLLPLLPGAEWTATHRAGLETHVASCDACRAEAELLALLRRHPVTVPPGLAERILDSPAPARRASRPAGRRYALAAALAGALLAGGLVRQFHEAADPAAPAPGTDMPASLLQSFWPGDGGLAAGITPPLHDLSVDELELLLAELES